MAFSIGLDIGGTKIAGAVFDQYNKAIAEITHPTPQDYSALVTTCIDIVAQLDQKSGGEASVGIGIPGAIERRSGMVVVAANTPCLNQKPLKADLEAKLTREVKLANDADCAALSEAVDGAGAGYDSVFGLIMGTGVGGGFVYRGQLIQGANGLNGEFGQLPLPHRDPADGPIVDCVCGQRGCIDKTISGGGLARLYQSMTGKQAEAVKITDDARKGDTDALRVLDQFYTTVAKAMVGIIHNNDPDIIVVSGGLNQLPGLYEQVPKRWEKYTMIKNINTKFVPAKHGATSGLRGAAWVGRQGLTLL